MFFYCPATGFAAVIVYLLPNRCQGSNRETGNVRRETVKRPFPSINYHLSTIILIFIYSHLLKNLRSAILFGISFDAVFLTF